MALRVASGKLVGAGGVEKISRKGPQFGAVEVALVVHRQALVTGVGVHAPTDVRDGIRLTVAPSGVLAAHQFRIGAFAFDSLDKVILDP